jgi:Co/Zn/Cd efflux system component
MLAVAGLAYSAIFSFVLSSAEHNRRNARAHSPTLTYVGYMLCGLTITAAGLLPVWAHYNPADVAALNNMRITL